jgi:hypothetical protein
LQSYTDAKETELRRLGEELASAKGQAELHATALRVARAEGAEMAEEHARLVDAHRSLTRLYTEASRSINNLESNVAELKQRNKGTTTAVAAVAASRSNGPATAGHDESSAAAAAAAALAEVEHLKRANGLLERDALAASERATELERQLATLRAAYDELAAHGASLKPVAATGGGRFLSSLPLSSSSPPAAAVLGSGPSPTFHSSLSSDSPPSGGGVVLLSSSTNSSPGGPTGGIGLGLGLGGVVSSAIPPRILASLASSGGAKNHGHISLNNSRDASPHASAVSTPFGPAHSRRLHHAEDAEASRAASGRNGRMAASLQQQQQQTPQVRTAILLRTPDGSQRNVSAGVVGGDGGLDSVSNATADAAAEQHDSADDDDDEEEEEEAASSPLTITHHGHGGAQEPQPESAGIDVQGQSPSPSSLPPRCAAPLPPVPASSSGSHSDAPVQLQLSGEEARARLASIPLAVGLLFSEAATNVSDAGTSASSDGVVVTAVKDGQAACLAGLRVGDVLLSLRGHPTSSKAAFLSSLRGARAGDRVPVHLRRDGETVQLELILGGRGCTEQEIEAIRRQAGLE